MVHNTQDEHPRLFVAVPIPSGLKAQVAAAANGLKKTLPFKKWVHPDDLHITLKFLGEVVPSSVAAVEAELERIAARSTPFPLRLQGAGTFGAPMAPRILWVGLAGKLQALRDLQADVERQLAPLGYPTEDRPYSPHVTLARQYAGGAPARKDAVRGLFPADAEPPLEWAADRIVLYRSHLGRTPMYEPVRTIAFHAGG
ncbi:RNA 2',3'-cyclic phosphodiesterase [Paenibacillus flagellatus]|uniref:RNA 2',3'-cyclic phosphodiesterase n=2 Tax=Paenibacillus flagellatus TaxID=2211139 RepID=A0A2V5KEA1_9BACL|nr:RNA 2',3'-cyclic phosphodiesterase [Paenibacillus flagellatus]